MAGDGAVQQASAWIFQRPEEASNSRSRFPFHKGAPGHAATLNQLAEVHKVCKFWGWYIHVTCVMVLDSITHHPHGVDNGFEGEGLLVSGSAQMQLQAAQGNGVQQGSSSGFSSPYCTSTNRPNKAAQCLSRRNHVLVTAGVPRGLGTPQGSFQHPRWHCKELRGSLRRWLSRCSCASHREPSELSGTVVAEP